MNIPDTHVIKGTQKGPTVTIFAGLHGNEMAGVLALQELLPIINITRGSLYIVFANPPAIEAGVRMINKNMNRCFYPGNSGTSYEDHRAQELMKILDLSDALLDLHMYYDDDGEPFIICEAPSIPIATKMDVGIISTNWSKVEPGGADGYMHEQGKIGICVECGPLSRAKEYKDFAINTIYQFLQYFTMIEPRVSYSESAKTIIVADRVIYKDSDSFTLADGLHTFDKLDEGRIFARSKKETLAANKDDYILFPHYEARLHEEACIIGHLDKSSSNTFIKLKF